MAKKRRPSTKRCPESGAFASHFDLPVELWSLIADLSQRPALASLCLVSRGFYYLFNPVLYRDLNETRDRTYQALLRTLSSRRGRSSLGPHPASLARRLCLNCCRSLSIRSTEQALKNAFLPNLSLTNVSIGSRLQSLRWESSYMPETVADVLCDKELFPRLKELFVRLADASHPGSPRSSMRVLAIPGLETLSFEQKISNIRTFHWADLSGAIRQIPFWSPALHVLNIAIVSDHYIPSCACSLQDLVNDVYQLRFNDLRALGLTFTVGFSSQAYSVPDPSPLLLAHASTLTHVGLNMRPAPASPELPSDLLLSSFTGLQTYYNALASCKSLHSLTLLRGDDRGEDSELTVSTSVTRLRIMPLDNRNKRYCDLPIEPGVVLQLAKAFPNLTELEISITPPMSRYADYLTSLSRLRRLRLRQHRPNLLRAETCIYCGDYHLRHHIDPRPISQLAPPGPCAKEILGYIAPRLPALRTVEIRVTSDGVLREGETVDEWEVSQRDVTESMVEYEFLVVRKRDGESVEVRLVSEL